MLKPPSSINSLFNPALNNKLFQETFSSRPIKVVAPASGTSPEKMEQLQLLPHLTLVIPPKIMSQDILFHANNDEERFEQLRTALYDESNKTIIWTLRGGYGSARLINQLSTLPPPKHEKIFIGFSDNTALHLFLSQQWHWQSIHAAGLAELLDPAQDPQNYIRIAEIITYGLPSQSIDNLKPLNISALKANPIKGYLTGGNLTLVESSIGTPWQIQTATKILFLEEVGEKGYRIDRSLNHLRQAGLLKEVKAIIFGEFITKIKDKGVKIALERFAKETTMPIYQTDQFGHGKMNYPLIYNTVAEITPTHHQYYDLKMHPRSIIK